MRRSPNANPAKRRDNPGVISMSDFDRNFAAARTGYRTDQVAIDAGLRAHMIRVYNYMASGVALTGVVAWLTYQAAGGDAIQVSGGQISGLTAVRAGHLQRPADVGAGVRHAGPGVLHELPASTGCRSERRCRCSSSMPGCSGWRWRRCFSNIPARRSPGCSSSRRRRSARLSLYGYTTQRDLTGIGSFLFMGLIGIIIAMLVNMFLRSSGARVG